MNSITEEHIERFVRFPETLSGIERETIALAISKDPELKHLAEWFDEFYKELDNLDVTQSKTHIIRLTPLQRHKHTGSRNSQVVLAAMASSPQRSAIETVATLASDEAQTVARILKNVKIDEFQIHLIRNEEPVDGEHTIFSIEEYNMDLVLDRTRHLSITDENNLAQLDWEESTFSLRTPVAECTLSAERFIEDSFSEQFGVANEDLIVSFKQGKLSLVVTDQSGHPSAFSRILLSGKELGTKLIRLNEEESITIDLQTKESLTIQLFN